MASRRPVPENILRSERLRRYYGVSLYVDPAPSRDHLRMLRAAPYYMTMRRIAELAGVYESNLSQIVRGTRGEARGYEPVKSVHYDTETAILSVRPENDPPERGGGRVPPLGARRRLQALAAAGFPLHALSKGMDWGEDPQPVHRFITGKSGSKFVMHSTYRKACELYDKLEMVDPLETGYSKISVSRARSSARKNGYAPPHCWDPDTIDDPDAIPEWTGACGTPEGLRIHYRDGIPTCKACRDNREANRYVNAGSATSDFRGAKLTRVREGRGLSIKALAELLSIDKGTVYYWETGRSSPRSRSRLAQLCAVLGCMESDLCEDDDD